MKLETTPERSKIMSKIKGHDTKIEVILRKALWHKGIRYRKNYLIQNCRVDIAITKYQIAIFCDGSFWHGRTGDGSQVHANTKFWNNKIRRNIERDLENTISLRDKGWTVIRFWDNEINNNIEACLSAVIKAINIKEVYYGRR